MATQDLCLRNAHIITMNPQQPVAEAIAIRDGRIAAIGSWESVQPHKISGEAMDLDGKTILPGFIDTHAHFLWTALSKAATDLSPAQDHESLAALMQEELARNPDADAFVGMGYNEYALDTSQFSPIITILDAVVPDRPVFLIGISGHSSALNSRALELLALPATTPGLLHDGHGKPNGLLTGAAHGKAFSGIGERLMLDDKAAAMIPATVHAAQAVGITTLHALEGSPTGEGDEAVISFLEMIPRLPLRIVLYFQTLDVEKVERLGLPRIGGCIMLDGDLDPCTAALMEPYAHDADHYGTLYFTQEEVNAFVLEAHKAGLQVALHAVGDAAIEQALVAYETALSAIPKDDHRHRIEHCTLMRDDQILRAENLRVALGIQPPFNIYWPQQESISILGEARARRVDSVRRLMRPNLLVAGGSDSFVTPLGPLLGVHAAVNHSNPMERVSVYEAIKLYTIQAARMGFQERDRGSLEVGKLGDLVVLGQDPTQIDPRMIKEIPIEMTVLGGKIVHP